jgi:hypothetical protein
MTMHAVSMTAVNWTVCWDVGPRLGPAHKYCKQGPRLPFVISAEAGNPVFHCHLLDCGSPVSVGRDSPAVVVTH